MGKPLVYRKKKGPNESYPSATRLDFLPPDRSLCQFLPTVWKQTLALSSLKNGGTH